MYLGGSRKSSSLNINLLIPKESTGVQRKRQNERKHLTTVSVFPVGKIKNHPGEAEQASEDEINGAYLKDIREQSSCHIPVIKYRTLAFQHTVPCLYEDDSRVSFLSRLISTWRWGMGDGQRSLHSKLGSGTSYPRIGSPQRPVRCQGARAEENR